eukprot:CAMPEP_0197660882 /NCGR_PEP_ID=MMETSP1338-20131121/51121_1 /TAXON_ID=43686 ORGANISM="Pelagodinium beii, Strain RCC1491" /NCGR_SAMPLE_ID=MMETSP1338 /ASSEMBLY_ACC=CAM_ASM_000754 /LENGTH=43 /DNA_ID= /DNA_START= /DNA_END= /DNA_ORIENTATION=
MPCRNLNLVEVDYEEIASDFSWHVQPRHELRRWYRSGLQFQIL